MKEITKNHWIESKEVNENLILQNTIQIEMAKKVIELCELRIKEFEEKEQDEKNETE